MSFKGYTSFVKKHLDLRGLGIVVLGLGLPSIATWMVNTGVGSRVRSYVDMVPGMTTKYGKAALAVGLTAGVSYLAAHFGAISAAEAMTASMIGFGLVSVGLLQSMSLPVGGNFVDALPASNLGGLAGGASYGYIGNYNEGVGAEMLPQPQSQQLFGVRANVF